MPKPDEISRAWTRPEDYWPPLRSARPRRSPGNDRKPGSDVGDPLHSPRLLLSAVPFTLLMLSLAVLAGAILVAAWPGRHVAAVPAASQVAEPGTAPKGWMDAG